MLEWARGLGRHEQAEPREAVAEAYGAHLADVYRFIYRRVGHAQTAEDLTGDVFIKAVQWLRSAYDPPQIQAWLYATARTTIVDHWQRQAGETVDLAVVEHVLFDPDPDQDEQGIGAPPAEDQAQRLLAALSERERAVLTLRFLRGYTTAEVARELELSDGNVKVIQHRALKRAAALGLESGEPVPPSSDANAADAPVQPTSRVPRRHVPWRVRDRAPFTI